MIPIEMHRLRALQNERRARAAADPLVKAEWEALAIEWDALANASGRGSDDIEQFDFA